MIRIVFLGIVCTVISIAQEKPASTLPALRENAQQKAAAWDALAQDLETRIARLLPCDPRVSGAIEEVSRASDNRLAALRQYLDADQARAKTDADTALRLIGNHIGLKAELNTERAEAQQEGIAIDGLLVEAGESSKRRPALENARKALEGLAGMTRQRDAQAEAQATGSDTLDGALTDLGAALQTRQAAVERELRSLDAEISRWREYYAARLARAQTECSVINPQAPTPRRPATRRKKQ